MKAYIVKLKGLNSSTSVNYQYNIVLADDPTSAYNKVRNYLDEKELGFPVDRCLQSIELLADEYEYSECRTRLFK